jgi:pSer/pThr/pTyr-binding forkhead associated (FHA) protein
MPHTAWLTGPKGERWPLDGERCLIGREAPADVIVELPRVSRQHALITRIERGYYLGDLNSRNGTFINGAPVPADAVRLKDGDQIVLGGVASFSFHDPGETIEGPRLGQLTGVWIDDDAHTVWVDARPVDPPLSAAQYTLLKLLYDQSGQLVTREQIIRAVWPEADPTGVSEEAIDGLIKRLRARLREIPTRLEYIEVLRGQGLRLRGAQG